MAYGFVAILLLGCAIAGWRNRFARPASALAFGLLLGVVLSAFPPFRTTPIISISRCCS